MIKGSVGNFHHLPATLFYLRIKMNTPASIARIAISTPSPVKNRAGTSAIKPESMSHTASSSIPMFFEKSMPASFSLSAFKSTSLSYR